MNEPAGRTEGRKGLNPELKSETNTSRDTETSSRPPIDTASVQRQEGRGWPIVWLVVTILCILIGIYLIVG